MFDIDRGAVRKRLYAGIEYVQKATATVAASTVIIANVITQFGDLGVEFPTETVTVVGSVVAVTSAVTAWVAKISKDRVVDEIDGVLKYIDSTPE